MDRIVIQLKLTAFLSSTFGHGNQSQKLHFCLGKCETWTAKTYIHLMRNFPFVIFYAFTTELKSNFSLETHSMIRNVSMKRFLSWLTTLFSRAIPKSVRRVLSLNLRLWNDVREHIVCSRMLLSVTLPSNLMVGSDAMQSRASHRAPFFDRSELSNVRYINTLTWLPVFQVLSLNSRKRLGYGEKTTKQQGAFHSIKKKTPYWSFRNFQKWTEEHFAEFPEKRTNLQGILKCSEISYRTFAFHLPFSQKMFGWIVRLTATFGCSGNFVRN